MRHGNMLVGNRRHSWCSQSLSTPSSSRKKKGASIAAQLVKNLPAMQETWVKSLAWEDPLEKGKTTHYSIIKSWT